MRSFRQWKVQGCPPPEGHWFFQTPAPGAGNCRALPPTAAAAVWLHSSSGWFLETHATSVLHHPCQDSGPTITTILRVICGMSYHEFHETKVNGKLSAPSFPSFLWIMQSKLVSPVTQRMSFYREYQREKTCTVGFGWIDAHTHSHWPVGALVWIHLHILCRGRQISLNNIGNTTLGTQSLSPRQLCLCHQIRSP